MYPLWTPEPGPCPQGCVIVSGLLFSCLCVPSLPWLATVPICPLELREGHGSWDLFPINKKWDRKASMPRRCTGSCSVSGGHYLTHYAGAPHSFNKQAEKDLPLSLPGTKCVSGRSDLRPIRQQSLTAPTSQKRSKPS